NEIKINEEQENILQIAGLWLSKGRSKKNNDQDIMKQTFLCRYSGTFALNKTAPLEEQHNTQSYRIGCPWHVNINKNDSGYYTVTSLVNKHEEHILSPTQHTYYLNFRKENIIAQQQNQLLLSKYKQYIAKKDLYNAVVEYQVDPVIQALTHLFWIEPHQLELYAHYGFIIAYDNIAKTNVHNFSLSFFIVVDNNYNSRPVAQAFIKDESLKLYSWTLCMFSQAVSLPPPIIITDTDPAMDAFYQCWNRLKVDDFERQYSELVESYSIIQKYL
ncbi:11665_t:CDS:2, partial [Gigaspora margarita]